MTIAKRDKILMNTENRQITVEYTLFYCAEDGNTRYGIDAAIPDEEEFVRISDITSESQRADECYRAVVAGRVTPAALYDVICDFVSD